jgi:hypothetical protein
MSQPQFSHKNRGSLEARRQRSVGGRGRRGFDSGHPSGRRDVTSSCALEASECGVAVDGPEPPIGSLPCGGPALARHGWAPRRAPPAPSRQRTGRHPVSFLAPLNETQRNRLVAAMSDVERLLTAGAPISAKNSQATSEHPRIASGVRKAIPPGLPTLLEDPTGRAGLADAVRGRVRVA